MDLDASRSMKIPKQLPVKNTRAARVHKTHRRPSFTCRCGWGPGSRLGWGVGVSVGMVEGIELINLGERGRDYKPRSP